jgi:lysophospholipase L1-like esterase
MKTRVFKITIFLAAVIASLVITEALLRLTTTNTFLQHHAGETWPWIVNDPILGWTNLAGYEDQGVRINSYGFRGRDFSVRKPPGVLRIVCMGDSGTFGIWYGRSLKLHKDNYPEELRVILRKNGENDVEVINAGVVGYASSHALRQLIAKVLDLEPDIVTLRVGFNDQAKMTNKNTIDYYVEEPSNFILRKLLYHFYDWRLTRLVIRLNQKLRIMDSPEKESTASSEEFRKNIERFIEVAREHDIKLLFIDYPLRDSRTMLTPSERKLARAYGATSLPEISQNNQTYQEIVSEIANAEKVPIVDTVSFSKSLDREHSMFSYYDFVHPNKKGARFIAEQVYDKLLALGWLKH